MPTSQDLAVKSLALDVRNFRTVAQQNEASAIHALIALKPEYFWGLMESLLDDGYLPTENIIVLIDGKRRIVKEGNRRIACLKIAHGYIAADDFDLPSHIAEKIADLPAAWKKANTKVPCAVFEAKEKALADRVVALAHGKGQKAGRLPWESVARARHDRDMLGTSEPALDLLEKYLKRGKNLTSNQAERWAGDYNVSVLEEAMKRLAPRLKLRNSVALAQAYPRLAGATSGFDELLHDIGLEEVAFKHIREPSFGADYGMPPPTPSPTGGANPSAGETSSEPGKAAGDSSNSAGEQTSASGGEASNTGNGSTKSKPAARAAGDPRSVAAALKAFKPRGKGREKVVTLLDEMKLLKIEKHPHAFCFLLRSMFEISAKAYCNDHPASGGGPPLCKKDGSDRPLVEVLRDIVEHLTDKKKNKETLKRLQGPMTQLAKSDSLLSVTSLNQLVHNTRFVASPSEISLMFANVFPLLEEMNK